MSDVTLRALRGATTCVVDTVEEITAATQELLVALMERNDLDHDDVVSVIFTATPDLASTFPATAARGVGFGDVPLLCATEIDVPGAQSPVHPRVAARVRASRAHGPGTRLPTRRAVASR